MISLQKQINGVTYFHSKGIIHHSEIEYMPCGARLHVLLLVLVHITFYLRYGQKWQGLPSNFIQKWGI